MLSMAGFASGMRIIADIAEACDAEYHEPWDAVGMQG
jgi:hypothetical protein